MVDDPNATGTVIYLENEATKDVLTLNEENSLAYKGTVQIKGTRGAEVVTHPVRNLKDIILVKDLYEMGN